MPPARRRIRRPPVLPVCHDRATLLHTADAGQSWDMIAQEPDYAPRGVVRVDLEHAYAPCGNAVCATSDGGVTWFKQTFDGLALSDIRFIDRERGFATVNRCGEPRDLCDSAATLLFTSDSGQTWKPIETADIGNAVLVRAVGPALDGGGTGIAYFDFATKRWTAASTNARPEPKDIRFTSRDVGYAIANNYEHRVVTLDGGETWLPTTDVPQPLPLSGVRSTWEQDGPIRISQDDGATWREIAPPPDSEIRGDRSVVAAAGDRIWLQMDSALWRTDDAGVTWKRLIEYGFERYNLRDADHGWMPATSNSQQGTAINFTSDGGDSWEHIELPQAVARFVFVSPSEIWATTGGRDSCLCIIVSRDYGRTWETISSAPWHINELVVASNGELWGLSQFFSEASVMVMSADRGATWQEDFRIQGAYPTHLVHAADRLWLYYSTSRANLLHGDYNPPGRTIIYRRDLGP